MALEALTAAQRSIEIVSQILKDRGESLPRSWGRRGGRKRNWSPATREAARERMKQMWAEGKMTRKKDK